VASATGEYYSARVTFSAPGAIVSWLSERFHTHGDEPRWNSNRVLGTVCKRAYGDVANRTRDNDPEPVLVTEYHPQLLAQMPTRSRKAIAWTAGVVALTASGLAGSALLSLSPTAAVVVTGGLGAAALAGWLVVRMGRPPVLVTPVPVANADSLPGKADRLRLLESAVIHAHDAVVVMAAEPKDGAGRSVLYVNDAFCQMTGYDRAEVVGRSLHFLRGPDSDPNTLDQIRRALDEGRPLRVELRNYRKDGSGFWVDLSLVPVPDPDGRATHWVMIQRDITDRRAAGDALRRSEERYRQLFDSNPHPMWVFDRETLRFLAVNEAAVHKYGYTRDEFLKLTIRDISRSEDVQRLVAHVAEKKTGYDAPTLWRHRTKDGTLLDVEISSFHLTMDGRPAELVLVNDVTEKLLLEEQLRQAQKMEVIGQMAGGVAHDFNNLLTGILGNLSLTQLPEGDPNRPLLAAAEQAAVRAADLTGKLLGYARRNQLVFAPVDPGEAFGEVIGLLRRTLDPRIRLTVRVAPGCESVQADPTLLTQALMNLCLNARDAMPDGGTITMSAESVTVTEADAGRYPGDARAGEFVRLTVSDTGVGMTEEVKARIFEPFFTTKEVGKGTGLGLPMVQGIVKQHRGWITCSSAPGAGTRLDLYLPPADPAAVPRSVLRSSLRVATPPPQASIFDALVDTPPDGSDARPTVLLVDDEAMIRDIGRAVLARAGFRVLTADDGAEAVEVFTRERDRITLVILDVTMPRMSGRDAFRHMVEVDPAARVLFSTGYSAEDIAELDGSVGLLGKPYRPHELLAAVRAALAVQPVAQPAVG
jgi:PAS domain S-box-containing protein